MEKLCMNVSMFHFDEVKNMPERFKRDFVFRLFFFIAFIFIRKKYKHNF